MKGANIQTVSFTILLVLVGCGSQVVTEQFPVGTSPEEAIEMVEERRDHAYEEQADALAHAEFKKGMEALEEAREELRDNDREDALEEAELAKAYFEKAVSLADQRKPLVDDVLESREATVRAGVEDYADLRERREDIDEDLRDETDNYEAALDIDEFNNLQKRYLDLEVEATQRKELATVRESINNAIDKDGYDLAPNTLKMTQKHLAAAENLIATNVRFPNEYSNSVVQAKESSELLDDVMTKFDKLGDNITEQAALELVYQDRRIETQNQRIGSLKGDVQQYATGMSLLGQEVSSQQSELMSAQSQIEFQKALERVTRELPESDAEVYQQGDKLIIRLKKMNFATGSAQIPEESKSLLDNIGEVIGELNPASIVVQGHTDSVGSNQINQELSDKRAESVKDYFANKQQVDQSIISARGLGENAPLASNDSREGRSQNRRVDIVIQAKPPQTYSE